MNAVNNFRIYSVEATLECSRTHIYSYVLTAHILLKATRATPHHTLHTRNSDEFQLFHWRERRIHKHKHTEQSKPKWQVASY